jgi:uncharacterized sulfatase
VALFLGSNWPHVPWPPVDGYSPEQVHVGKNHIDTPVFRTARAQYLTAVTAMDTELGSVYETAMEVLGAEKTFVLFTSDHGAQLPFGKWNLYDEGTKVPLIVKWPGVVKSGSETKAMVQWMDIMPTLMEVGGGMSGSGNFDGKSFVKVLRGESQNHHEWIYTTHSNDNNMNVYPMRSVRSERYKLIWNLHPEFQFTTHIDRSDEAPSRQYWMSWENRAKADQTAAKLLSRYHVRPELELYDLENDPLELRNLAGLPEHSERVEAMKAQITDWMKQQGDQQKVVGKPLMVGEPIPLIRRPAAKKKASAKQKRAE